MRFIYIVFLSLSLYPAKCLTPYSVAGPLKPTVIHYSSSTPSDVYETNKISSHATYNEQGAKRNERGLPIELAASIAGGIIPAPDNLYHFNLRTPPAINASHTEQASRETALQTLYHLKHIYGDFVTSTALGLTYAALFGPATWVSFTSRSFRMRRWYATITCGVSLWFTLTELCIVILQLPTFLSFILCKGCSVTVGVYAFTKPNIGWLAGFILCSILYARLLSIFIFHFSFIPSCFMTFLILALQIIMEIKMKDVTQSLITSSTSAFMSTACISFLGTYFGFQSFSPYDFIGFFTLPVNHFRDLISAKVLLFYWLCLSIFSTLVQTLRTSQGKTIPFPSIVTFISQNLLKI